MSIVFEPVLCGFKHQILETLVESFPSRLLSSTPRFCGTTSCDKANQSHFFYRDTDIKRHDQSHDNLAILHKPREAVLFESF